MVGLLAAALLRAGLLVEASAELWQDCCCPERMLPAPFEGDWASRACEEEEDDCVSGAGEEDDRNWESGAGEEEDGAAASHAGDEDVGVDAAGDLSSDGKEASGGRAGV